MKNIFSLRRFSLSGFWLLLLLVCGSTARAQAPVPPDSALRLETPLRCDQATFSWQTGRATTTGYGKYSLLVVQAVASSDAPVVPLNGQTYIASSFFRAGQQLAPRQYTVYADTGHTVAVLGLTANTTYRADVLAYTDSSAAYPGLPGPLYAEVDSSATLYFTTPPCPSATPPTQGASGSSATVLDCSTAQVSVRRGNGDGRLLVVRRVTGDNEAELSTQPATGQFYFPVPLFGQGQAVAPDAFAISLGPDSAATVYGLIPGQRYKFVAYEYRTARDPFGNDTQANPGYTAPSDTAYFDVPLCASPEPLMPAQLVQLTDTTGTSVRISWTNGTGSERLVVVRSIFASSSLMLPTQGTRYLASPVFGEGSSTRPDCFVVAAGSDSTVLLTQLMPNSLYQVSVYEYTLDTAGTPTYLLSKAPAAGLILTRTTPEPLPVTLVSFTGLVGSGGRATLTWRTVQELNSAYFEIERSADGRQFQPVGRRQAAGTTSQARQYQYRDSTALAGLTYYRLRQVDVDGRQSYSQVLALVVPAVITSPAIRAAIWPNPVHGRQPLHLRLEGHPATRQAIRVRIRSLASGARLVEQLLPAADPTDFSCPLPPLPVGVYLVEIQTTTGNWVTRLLVD